MTGSGRLVLIAAATGLAMLASTHTPATVAAAGVPAPSASHYVLGSYVDMCDSHATTECPLYADGAGQPGSPVGGMTILDFGAPCFEPATLVLGTQLLNSQSCTPNATIVMLARAWLRGYESNPEHSASSSPILVIGTSNSLTAAVAGNALTGEQMSLHGHAWFSSVVSRIASVAQALPFPVTTWAGDDIEESGDGNWYDGATTAAWVDAYATASRATKPCSPSRNGLMVDYGDYVPNQPGWSPGIVYHVAWQAPPGCPVPEIYQAANAAEWQGLNQYAQGAGLPQMVFTGVLSEDGVEGSLSSSDSWSTLMTATGQAPPYVSVIDTTGPIAPVVPDPPTGVTAVRGPETVTLRWSAPAWDGGAAVNGYTVTVYAGATLAQTLDVTGWPALESTIVGGLVNGRSYEFYVSATNRAGMGPRSRLSGSAIPGGPSPMR